MDPSFYQSLIDEAVKAGVREVGLYLLGEPLLLRHLPAFVHYARENGIDHVFITTNGVLATPERMIPLIEAGLTSVKFSVNGHTPERYREMHGIDGFETVMGNIRWLSDHIRTSGIDTIQTSLSTIFSDALPRKTQEELRTFLRTAEQFVDFAYFLPLYNQGGHVGGREYTRIVGNPGRWDNLVPSVPCWQLFNAAKVTWDGLFNACCFDHHNEFVVADLHEVSLLDAWASPKFVELRRQHLEEDLEGSLCARCLGVPSPQTGS